MKSISIFLPILFLSSPLVFAGGESGNGRTRLPIQIDSLTGNAEARSIFEARTIHQIDIQDVQSVADAYAETMARLGAIDDEFSLYFNEALAMAQAPTFLTESNAPSTTAVQFDNVSGVMEVLPIFNDPKLGATSRAALTIQGAIYLLSLQFLSSPDLELSETLMIRLMAKEIDASEISRLTHEVFPPEVRRPLFLTIPGQ